MKKTLIILIVLIMTFGMAMPVALADGERRVVLTNCENLTGWSLAAMKADDTTRVQGKYSIGCTSVWPNAKYNIDKALIQNSGIPYENAYFQYYIYISDASKHCLNGYFKLSADYDFDDSNGNDIAENNVFKWEFSTLGLVTGWNFVSVKFTDMAFVGDASLKREVYANLEKFYYVDPAKSIPGATGEIWETMYMVSINIDEIVLSDTHRSILPEDIVSYSTTRWGDVHYTGGIYEGYFDKPDETNAFGDVLTVAIGVVATAAVIAVMLVIKRRVVR